MIKQMKYFQAGVRLQSFNKAADECFISQSAISQQHLRKKALSVLVQLGQAGLSLWLMSNTF